MSKKISDREIAAISLLHRWMANKPHDWKHTRELLLDIFKQNGKQ